jgi:hypothetical protein
MLRNKLLDWNLAEEYAERFYLPGQSPIEADWQFRERVARNLAEMEKELLAQEVLYNQRMSANSFAHGDLSSGYGDALITQIARRTEAAFQREKRQQEHRQRQQRLFATLCPWLKPRAK